MRQVIKTGAIGRLEAIYTKIHLSPFMKNNTTGKLRCVYRLFLARKNTALGENLGCLGGANVLPRRHNYIDSGG